MIIRDILNTYTREGKLFMDDFWKWFFGIFAPIITAILAILNSSKFKQERKKLRLENLKLENEIKIMRRKSKLECEKLKLEIIKLQRDISKQDNT